MLFTYRQEGGWRHVLIAGIAAGLSVLTRANNLFLLPMFGLYLLWVEFKATPLNLVNCDPHPNPLPVGEGVKFPPSPSGRGDGGEGGGSAFPLLTFIITIALSGVIMLAYNNARSGDPFKTGYDLSLFSPNVLLGLYKLLFSPLRGFFIHSPILLLSIPGWWQLRRSHPAEAWLMAACVGLTLALFSAWSSGEGLSWGSRFLVPLVPFFALCLTPIISGQLSAVSSQQSAKTSHFSPLTSYLSPLTSHLSPLTSYLSPLISHFLLLISFSIQLLAIIINPWVHLNKLQTEFGGEFFLEKTAALYDFRYSQIIGQLQSWSVTNSDLIWWQPWGLDWFALTLTLSLIFFTSLTLYKQFHPSHLSPLTSHLSPLTSHFSFLPSYFSLLTSYFFITKPPTSNLAYQMTPTAKPWPPPSAKRGQARR